MEWSCSRCGQTASASDWHLLLAIGWKLDESGNCICVMCHRDADATLKRPPSLAHQSGAWIGPPRDTPHTALREPRARRPR